MCLFVLRVTVIILLFSVIVLHWFISPHSKNKVCNKSNNFKKILLEIGSEVNYALYTTTRKYPLRGYILGVLTHTTAWDRLWVDDVFLKIVYT